MPSSAEVARFDPADPQLAADPDGYWSAISTGPDRLFAGRNAVALWRHADVAAILQDREGTRKCPERALAAFPPGPFRDHNAATMAFLDPPDHGPVRRRFARAFAPSQLARLEDTVETMSAELLADLDWRHPVDLALAYAERLPVRVIGAILGVALDEERALRRAAHAVVAGLEPGAAADTLAAADEAIRFLCRLLEPMLARPDAGSLFALLAEDAGDIDRDLLLHNAIFLLNAGHETTSRLIAGIGRALLADSVLATRVADDPLAAAGLVEEVLRLDPPLHFVPRFLARARVDMPAGTLVYLLIAAANRDPAAFDAPARLDVDRRNARAHLAFAAGPHLCLGASLARMEGRIAAQHLARLTPGLAALRGATRAPGRMFQGWARVPAELPA